MPKKQTKQTERPKVECAFGKLVPLDSLVPHPRNPNKHPEKQLELLAKIIRAHGWRAPITVSKRSKFVVRGHGRLLAARKLGLDLVPVDFQDYPSEEAELADLVADNQIGELSELDDEMLADVLSDLSGEGYDLDLTGFSPDDLPSFEGKEAPEEFEKFDEDVETSHKCPKCGFEWS
jgi:ParB-like chromosome segregation protein Spo0J